MEMIKAIEPIEAGTPGLRDPFRWSGSACPDQSHPIDAETRTAQREGSAAPDPGADRERDVDIVFEYLGRDTFEAGAFVTSRRNQPA